MITKNTSVQSTASQLGRMFVEPPPALIDIEPIDIKCIAAVWLDPVWAMDELLPPMLMPLPASAAALPASTSALASSPPARVNPPPPPRFGVLTLDFLRWRCASAVGPRTRGGRPGGALACIRALPRLRNVCRDAPRSAVQPRARLTPPSEAVRRGRDPEAPGPSRVQRAVRGECRATAARGEGRARAGGAIRSAAATADESRARPHSA